MTMQTLMPLLRHEIRVTDCRGEVHTGHLCVIGKMCQLVTGSPRTEHTDTVQLDDIVEVVDLDVAA